MGSALMVATTIPMGSGIVPERNAPASSGRSVTDPVEVRLRDLVKTMTEAWQKGACGPECALGNMTALAGAILAFYMEQQLNIHDHWSNYRAR
mgnify:CR=1 FL=1